MILLLQVSTDLLRIGYKTRLQHLSIGQLDKSYMNQILRWKNSLQDRLHNWKLLRSNNNLLGIRYRMKLQLLNIFPLDKSSRTRNLVLLKMMNKYRLGSLYMIQILEENKFLLDKFYTTLTEHLNTVQLGKYCK